MLVHSKRSLQDFENMISQSLTKLTVDIEQLLRVLATWFYFVIFLISGRLSSVKKLPREENRVISVTTDDSSNCSRQIKTYFNIARDILDI